MAANTNNTTTITCTIDGVEVTGTIDTIISIIGHRAGRGVVIPEPKPEPKPEKAPENAPKPKKAPETAPAKADPAPKPEDEEWYAGVITSPWVKEWKAGPKSTIVKVRPETGHGVELRTAGFRPMRGNHWWWAPKDESAARANGEKYLANKAARQAKSA